MPRSPRIAPVSDERTPDGGPVWPERDLDPNDPSVTPRTETAPPTTTLSDDPAQPEGPVWDPRLQGERRRATTAEQAVPWLIGIVLALIGIVVVLLALIFTGPDGFQAIGSTPTPSADPSVHADPSAQASAKPEPSGTGQGASAPSASAEASPTTDPESGPTPSTEPKFGPLEMVYLGRPSSLAPIYLLRRDFTERADARVVAQADEGVERFAWSPDGRAGAAIIAGRAVALKTGDSPRRLADGVSAITFGWGSETLYALRIVQDGANDRATILEIDFVSGAVKPLASMTYPHPSTGPEAALKEAQFIDDGGSERLYAASDGYLVAWILGAPSTYRIDPGDGSVLEVNRTPVLWSPNGERRIGIREHPDGSTTLALHGEGSETTQSVTVKGLVSHVRWAPGSNEIVFTLGTASVGGGVHQDLYVWDLNSRHEPMALTADGSSFGAEWLGAMPNWVP